MPASARSYADARVCELEVAASITVITVMERTTVTPRARTRAKPRSSVSLCRSFPISSSLDPCAVPQENRVGELVGADTGSLVADHEVDAEGGETAAATCVRKAR